MLGVGTHQPCAELERRTERSQPAIQQHPKTGFELQETGGHFGSTKRTLVGQ